MLALLYACGRFFFDTLRATDLNYVDARYFGLTPAQYCCIVLIVFGIYGLVKWRAPPPSPRPRSAPAVVFKHRPDRALR